MEVGETTSNQDRPLQGPATLLVVEGLGTCQDSHLTGKAGAGQGSPLRVAQGPIGYGRGPPTRAHERRVSDFDCTITLPLLLEGAAMKTPACAGADTAPLHRVLPRLVSLGLELVVSLKTTTLATSDHRVPAATSATDDLQLRETLLADVHVGHLKSVLRHQSACDVRFYWTATMIKAKNTLLNVSCCACLTTMKILPTNC